MNLRQVFSDSWRTIGRLEKLKLIQLLLLQVLLNVLDILSLLVLSLLSFNFLDDSKGSSNNFISSLNNFLNLGEVNQRIKLLVLCFSLLLIKSLFTLFFTKHLLKTCENISLNLAIRIMNEIYFLKPINLSLLDNINLPQTITFGSKAIGSGVLAFGILSISEGIFLFLLIIPAIFMSPFITISIACIFYLGMRYTHYKISDIASNEGFRKTSAETKSLHFITEIWNNRKFISYSRNTSNFSKILKEDLFENFNANSKLIYLQQLPKVTLEILLLLSGALVVVFYAVKGNVSDGIATLILLLTISYRILPALLRLQGSIIFARANIIDAANFNSLNKLLNNDGNNSLIASRVSSDIGNTVKLPALFLENLSFSFDDKLEPVIYNLSAQVNRGTLTLLVGQSGTGKTTLIDLILGFRRQKSGNITFELPNDTKLKIAFMPQETQILPGSIWENIAFGVERKAIDKYLVEQTAKQCKIEYFLTGNGEEIFDVSKASGGEIQRIGLARALYTKPNFLILDEPTSSLDFESETSILETIKSLSGSMTILMVTHSKLALSFADNVINIADKKN
jgi:ATP-binding cassette subfamily C protein